MAVAFFMTAGPTPSQAADFEGIMGAHAVGVEDGGPGVPFFGWSTEAGDLRAPHFVGMHALQAIPLGLLALELLSGRVAVLRSVRVRFRLVLVGSSAFAALLGILTWQALAGESVIAPSGPILLAAAVAVVAAAGAAAAVLVAAHRRTAHEVGSAGGVRR
ncbi:hypothetical protein [Rathayibacter oskolensis]|uniref:hypothetical protein n=1 Tax=Rathayibacter oskolensis TaxID=1891671 RepID=UPI0013FDAEE3|nr:hypothetical protein [Rathayibacter oskolensis]